MNRPGFPAAVVLAASSTDGPVLQAKELASRSFVEDLGSLTEVHIAFLQVTDRRHETGVSDGPGGCGSAAPGARGPGGDADTLRFKDATCRLDPTALGSHLIDESDDQWWRGSSSLAKKKVGAFRMSIVSSRSLTSRFVTLISSS